MNEINQPKFKVGEIVVYKNGPTYHLGEIQEVIKLRTEERYGFIGTNKYGYAVYAYRALFNADDTTFQIDEDDLRQIDNANAFNITRKKVDWIIRTLKSPDANSK